MGLCKPPSTPLFIILTTPLSLSLSLSHFPHHTLTPKIRGLFFLLPLLPLHFQASNSNPQLLNAGQDPRQCVQIAMVAKEFRGTWWKCRNLDFGREFAATQPHRLAYSAAVDHAIESHHKEGNIKTLQLCFNPSDVEFLLEKWVRKSVKKGVEELDLDIFQATVPFCVPTNVEEAKLKELKLYYSVIHMLFNLKALVSLTTLVLGQVDLTDLIIEVVFKNCVHNRWVSDYGLEAQTKTKMKLRFRPNMG